MIAVKYINKIDEEEEKQFSAISDGTRKLQDLYCYEFLHFVEQQGISDLKEINAQILYLRSSKQNLTRTRPPCKIAST